MGILDGFKQINVVSGKPTITITKNGLTFSKNAVYKLELSEYVNLYLNEQKKVLAVQCCPEKTNMSIQFAREDKDYVRWNNQDFLQTLDKLMEWDHTKYKYKIVGEYYSNEKLLYFDLNSAEIENND